ncbi:hypothetical protein [Arcobacter sp. LA11]|uniref:hypothetical protein n=1 Tax=Arcobacter sp. LA11 TaxID=1898176 RepID=UPI0009349B2E|nr:hypothetical protein [Arcobacter sp. LA11]
MLPEEKKQKIFVENLDAFSKVVDSILKNPEINVEFKKDPIKVLNEHGIKIEDSSVEEKLKSELLNISNGQPGDVMQVAVGVSVGSSPATIPIVAAVVGVIVAVNVGNGTENDIDRIFTIDKPRVDAFLDVDDVQERINMLESEIKELRSKLKK